MCKTTTVILFFILCLLILTGCSYEQNKNDNLAINETASINIDNNGKSSHMINEASPISTNIINNELGKATALFLPTSEAVTYPDKLDYIFFDKNMIVELNMNRPNEFPLEVYKIYLKKTSSYEFDIEELQHQLLDNKHSNNTVDTEHILYQFDGAISYYPTVDLINGLGTKNYPLFSEDLTMLLNSNAEKSVHLFHLNQITFDWEFVSTDLETISKLHNEALKILKGFGGKVSENPSVIISNPLIDGTKAYDFKYPKMLYNLVMQSSDCEDERAFDDGDEWGFIYQDTIHFIFMETGEIYLCRISSPFVETNREDIKASLLTYQEALLRLVVQKENYFTGKKIVITNMNPCYLKTAVSGNNEEYIAEPAWEVNYFLLYNQNSPEKVSGNHFVTYISAITGKIYD